MLVLRLRCLQQQASQDTADSPAAPLAGSLDIAEAGDGIYPVQYVAVQCPTTGPVSYSFQGSNDFYTKLQVANTP